MLRRHAASHGSPRSVARRGLRCRRCLRHPSRAGPRHRPPAVRCARHGLRAGSRDPGRPLGPDHGPRRGRGPVPGRRRAGARGPGHGAPPADTGRRGRAARRHAVHRCDEGRRRETQAALGAPRRRVVVQLPVRPQPQQRGDVRVAGGGRVADDPAARPRAGVRGARRLAAAVRHRAVAGRAGRPLSERRACRVERRSRVRGLGGRAHRRAAGDGADAGRGGGCRSLPSRSGRSRHRSSRAGPEHRGHPRRA